MEPKIYIEVDITKEKPPIQQSVFVICQDNWQMDFIFQKEAEIEKDIHEWGMKTWLKPVTLDELLKSLKK